METGGKVIANDQPGEITKVEKTKISNGVMFVTYIYVKLEGGTFANPYFPELVKPFKK